MSLHDTLLTALRIKGFAKADALAEMLDEEASTVEDVLARMTESGLTEETRIGLRLSADGKAAADALSARERGLLAPAAWDEAYDDFHHLNGPFKAAISDWQMRGDVPNDHADTDYDKSITDRIKAVHGEVVDLMTSLSAEVPRLSQYSPRFRRALQGIEAGDTRQVAAPIIDSYHTVWFELHEDLIRLSGRTRADEAKAGRAV